jgi:hypothetical protein
MAKEKREALAHWLDPNPLCTQVCTGRLRTKDASSFLRDKDGRSKTARNPC